MAQFRVPYLTRRPGRKLPDGSRAWRYFWTPSPTLRRAGWKEFRLDDDEATAIAQAKAQNDAVAADPEGAGTGSKAAKPGTLDALIQLYKADEKYLDLKAKTRRDYGYHLETLSAWAGDKAVAALTPKMVKTLYKSFRDVHHHKANALIVMLRTLLKFAISEDWEIVNVAKEIELRGTAPRHQVWTDRTLTAMLAAADAAGRPSIGDAMLLSLFITQREGDVLDMPWPDRDPTRIRRKQSKTDTWVEIRMVGVLQARLAAARTRQASWAEPGATFAAPKIVLSEGTRCPYKQDDFVHRFATIRAQAAADAEASGDDQLAAELLTLQFRDLRRTGMVYLGEAGANSIEASAVSGHGIQHSQNILDTYIPRNTAMANNAIDKLEDWMERKKEESA